MITQAQKQTYIFENGNRCPYCRSYNIESEQLMSEDYGASQIIECNDCHKAWLDILKLVDIKELK